MARMNPASQAKVTVVAIAAAVAGTLAGVAVSQWAAVADRQSIVSTSLNSAVDVALVVVGAIVVAARPRNLVGWLMLAGGVTGALGNAAVDLAYHGIVASPASVPGASAYAVTGAVVRSVGWTIATLAVPAFFPDGRLAGPRYRWLPRVLVVILIGAAVDPLTDKQADLTYFGGWHNPIAPHGAGQLVSAVAFAAHLPLSVVAVAAVVAGLVKRFRSGGELQRQQVLIFAVAAVLPILAMPIGIAGAGGWVFGVAALPLPFAVGFAVLARDLYDLRTAANRTLVWLTLSAVVAGGYALVIAGIGGLLHVDRHVSWLPWAAAAVVAVSFAPLRDSLQRAVNRITYGRWDEPYDVLAALGQRVEATADVDRLLADVVTELAGLGLRDIAIATVHGEVVAGDGGGGGALVEMPLSAYGEVVGALRYREPTTPLRSRDRRLLDDLAGHLGGVLHAHQLTSDLQAARERLVLAREEERRRLRRDLHDGLGPALAGHLLRLDILSARVGTDSVAAAEIDSLRTDLRATVAEVRRVVEGLRPPALDELGLVGAIEQVTSRLAAGTTMVMSVDSGALPALSAAVEVAAFRIVTEAVTNVVRHAAASSCCIALVAEHGRLRITVTDNGSGVRASRGAPSGHGLQTMRERAEELRGRLRVTRGASGVGTVVTAELPLPPAQRQHGGATSSVVAR